MQRDGPRHDSAAHQDGFGDQQQVAGGQVSDRSGQHVLDKQGDRTGYLKDPSTGQTVLSRLDEAGLEAIAQATGGEYFHRTGAVAVPELSDICRCVSSCEPAGTVSTRAVGSSSTGCAKTLPPRAPTTQLNSDQINRYKRHLILPEIGGRCSAAVLAVLYAQKHDGRDGGHHVLARGFSHTQGRRIVRPV